MNADKYNVCLIHEGDEEYKFFETMKKIDAVSPKICIENINAGGFGGVAPLFQDYRSYSLYDCVICLYDVDYRQNEPDSPFVSVREGLKEILDEDKSVEAVSFCTNPNFLQIYLLSMKELSEVELFSTSKKTNTELVHLCWPNIAKPKTNAQGKNCTKEYDASGWQLEIMNAPLMEGPHCYQKLLGNASALPENYLLTDRPGSNVLKLIDALLKGDCEFFESINKILDE